MNLQPVRNFLTLPEYLLLISISFVITVSTNGLIVAQASGRTNFSIEGSIASFTFMNKSLTDDNVVAARKFILSGNWKLDEHNDDMSFNVTIQTSLNDGSAYHTHQLTNFRSNKISVN